MVAALTSGTPAGGELAQLYREENLSDVDLARAAELIECTGARAWAQAQADALEAGALGHLHAATVAPAALEQLAHIITHRSA